MSANFEAKKVYDVATLARTRRMIGKPTKVIFDLFNYLDAGNQHD